MEEIKYNLICISLIVLTFSNLLRISSSSSIGMYYLYLSAINTLVTVVARRTTFTNIHFWPYMMNITKRVRILNLISDFVN